MFNNWIIFFSMINVNWKKSIRDLVICTCNCDDDVRLLLSIDNIALNEFTRVLLLFEIIFRIFLKKNVNFFNDDFIWNVSSFCISSNTLFLKKKILTTCARAILFFDDTKFSFELENEEIDSLLNTMKTNRAAIFSLCKKFENIFSAILILFALVKIFLINKILNLISISNCLLSCKQLI